MLLDLADGEVPDVEPARRQHGVGVPLGQRLRRSASSVAGAAARDHRNGDGAGDRAQQLDVVALAGAVAIHRREQDLAGAESRRLRGPLDRVEAGRRAPAVR